MVGKKHRFLDKQLECMLDKKKGNSVLYDTMKATLYWPQTCWSLLPCSSGEHEKKLAIENATQNSHLLDYVQSNIDKNQT